MTRRDVIRATRSPMNAKRWCLSLTCGHETWVTATRQPKIKRVDCTGCARGIETGTLIVNGASLGPAERDRDGNTESGPQVTDRAQRHKATEAWVTEQHAMRKRVKS